MSRELYAKAVFGGQDSLYSSMVEAIGYTHAVEQHLEEGIVVIQSSRFSTLTNNRADATNSKRRGNGYVATGCERMPRALYEAIRALEESTAAIEVLGQDVVDHYLNAARVEQQAFDEVVHPWERQRYLERS